MAKVTQVKSAAKAYPEQGISKGESYYSWTLYGKPVQRSKTYPKPSQITGSEFWKLIYSTLEEAESNPPSPENLGDALSSIVTDITELRDEQIEKREDLPENFKHGSSGERFESREEELDECLTALEQIDTDVPEGDDTAKSEWRDESWRDVIEALQNIQCD